MTLEDEIISACKRLIVEGFSPETVTFALSQASMSVGADRAYVFENSVEGGIAVMSQRFEWSIHSVEPHLDDPAMQNLPYAETGPDWPRRFAEGQCVQELARTTRPAFRAIMEAQSICSLLLCPIIAAEQVWGFVGFDDCRIERKWSKDEERMLSYLARALAGCLRHAKLRGNLAAARETVRVLMQKR
jgi:GAF domain-containing protein